MATRQLGNITIGYNENFWQPTAQQTQLYNAIGRTEGAQAATGNNPNFFQKRWNSIENAIGTTLASPISLVKDTTENISTDNMRLDNKASMNNIAKKYGYNSWSDWQDAFQNAKDAGDSAKVAEMQNQLSEFQAQANTNANAANEKAAAYNDWRNNNYVSNKINQNNTKFLGSAVNTLSTGLDITGLTATPLANAIQGGVEGVADELEQNGGNVDITRLFTNGVKTSGWDDFSAERAGQNALIGATTGAVTGALNKGLTNSMAKRGGNLFKGSNALTKGINDLGSKTALGRVGSTIATGAGRGAISGAVGGATGAGLSAAMNGGDVFGSALEGAKQGLQQGALTGGVMAGANLALSKTPGVGNFYNELNEAKTRWNQSGKNFDERLTNTLTSGDSAVGDWIMNRRQSRLLNSAGNIGDTVRNAGVAGKVSTRQLGNVMEEDGAAFAPKETVERYLKQNKKFALENKDYFYDETQPELYDEIIKSYDDQLALLKKWGDDYVYIESNPMSENELHILPKSQLAGDSSLSEVKVLGQETPTTAKDWLKKAGKRVVEDLNNKGAGLSVKDVSDDLEGAVARMEDAVQNEDFYFTKANNTDSRNTLNAIEEAMAILEDAGATSTSAHQRLANIYKNGELKTYGDIASALLEIDNSLGYYANKSNPRYNEIVNAIALNREAMNSLANNQTTAKYADLEQELIANRAKIRNASGKEQRQLIQRNADIMEEMDSRWAKQGSTAPAKYATIDPLNGERTEYSPAEVKRLITEYENYKAPEVLSGNSSSEVAEVMGDAGVTLSEIYRRANGGEFDPYSRESFAGFEKWLNNTKAEVANTPTTTKGWLKQAGKRIVDDVNKTNLGNRIQNTAEQYPEDIRNLKINQWTEEPIEGEVVEAPTMQRQVAQPTGDAWDRLAQQNGYNSYNDVIRSYLAANPGVELNPNGAAGQILSWLDQNPNTPTTAAGWAKQAGQRIAEDVNNSNLGMRIKDVSQDNPSTKLYNALATQDEKLPEVFEPEARNQIEKQNKLQSIGKQLQSSAKTQKYAALYDSLDARTAQRAIETNAPDVLADMGVKPENYLEAAKVSNYVNGTVSDLAEKSGVKVVAPDLVQKLNAATDDVIFTTPNAEKKFNNAIRQIVADGSTPDEYSAGYLIAKSRDFSNKAAKLRGNADDVNALRTAYTNVKYILRDEAKAAMSNANITGAETNANIAKGLAKMGADQKVIDYITAPNADGSEPNVSDYISRTAYFEQARDMGNQVAAEKFTRSASKQPTNMLTRMWRASGLEQPVNLLLSNTVAPAASLLTKGAGKVIEGAGNIGAKIGGNAPTTEVKTDTTAPTQVSTPSLANANNPAMNIYNAIGRTEGLTNAEQARTANYLTDAVQGEGADSGYMQPLAATESYGANTLESLAAPTATSTSLYNSMSGTPTTSTVANTDTGYFQPTGDYWTDILAKATSKAIDAKDVTAFASLYKMYQEALSKASSSTSNASNLNSWNSSDRTKLLSAQDALNQIDELENAYNSAVEGTGGTSNLVQGWLRTKAADLSGGNLDASASNYNKLAESVGMGIVKNLINLGVTESDAQRYLQYLPALTDTREQAAQKLETLRNIYQSKINNLYSAYGAA